MRGSSADDAPERLLEARGRFDTSAVAGRADEQEAQSPEAELREREIGVTARRRDPRQPRNRPAWA